MSAQQVSLAVCTGKINGPAASGKSYAFLCQGGEEKFLPSGGPSEVLPAIRGMKKEICGMVITRNVSLPEGTILKIFGTADYSTDPQRRHLSRIHTSRNVFIRLRYDAPLQRVGFWLPGLITGSVLPVWNTEGRFDILSDNDLIAWQTGTKGWSADVSDTFRTEVLAPALAAPPAFEILTKADGQTVAVLQPTRPRRRIVIRD